MSGTFEARSAPHFAYLMRVFNLQDLLGHSGRVHVPTDMDWAWSVACLDGAAVVYHWSVVGQAIAAASNHAPDTHCGRQERKPKPLSAEITSGGVCPSRKLWAVGAV